MLHDFIYGNESQSYSFLRVPMYFFKNEAYSEVSNDARILYSFMLNRVSLSIENGWFDDENRIYIIYTLEQVQNDIRCKNQKATKIMRELEDADLIYRKRQGQGKPSLIFVKNFIFKDENIEKSLQNDTNKNHISYTSNSHIQNNENHISHIQNNENHISKDVNNEVQEMWKSNGIYINNIKTNNSNNDIGSMYVLEQEEALALDEPTEATSPEEENNKFCKSVIVGFNAYISKVIGKITGLTFKQKQRIISLRDNYGFNFDRFKQLCDKINASEFLQGNNNNNWTPDLDWILEPENANKILADKYNKVFKASQKQTTTNSFTNYSQHIYSNEELEAIAERKRQKRLESLPRTEITQADSGETLFDGLPPSEWLKKKMKHSVERS